MQGNRGLNQALQELFFRAVSLPPDVLPHFVRVVEVLIVEEFNAPKITFRIHAQILAGWLGGDGIARLRKGLDESGLSRARMI